MLIVKWIFFLCVIDVDGASDTKMQVSESNMLVTFEDTVSIRTVGTMLHFTFYPAGLAGQ